jgi:cytochrome c
MFMLRCLFAALALSTVQAAAAERQAPQLGKAADAATLKAWNTDIFPDGEGLPSGSGTAAAGKQVYARYCLSCHGADGGGDSADELAGARHSLTDNPPDKTIGSYWPYAATVFDFTRRAMPLDAPGTLSNDQIYAVTAYLLFLNNLVKENDIIDARTLPEVKMPNRNGFIDVYAREAKRKR